MEILVKFFGKIKNKFTNELQKVKYRIVWQEDFDEVTGEFIPEFSLERRVNIGAWEVVKAGFRSEEEVRDWFDAYLAYLDAKTEKEYRAKEKIIQL